jgi:drug/metabolite transporter (DMT)-like permease
MSAADWVLLLILSVLWGGSFYFAKIAVPEIPPLTLALGRVGIAAIALPVMPGSSPDPFRAIRRSGCSWASWPRSTTPSPSR